jgi:TonB family protein
MTSRQDLAIRWAGVNGKRAEGRNKIEVHAPICRADAPVRWGQSGGRANAGGDSATGSSGTLDFARRFHSGLEARGFQGLVLRIEVDRTGSVTSAKVTEGTEEFRAAAVAMARKWRYKPFVRDGRAVPAAFTDIIMIRPPESPVRTNKAFPTVQNWGSVKIVLKRTPCFGRCPVYDVEIDGHGNVTFNGSVGERHRHISRETLEGLLEVFRKANYFSLDSAYRIGATALPTYITSISIDGHSMSVLDYGGLQVGMPVSVREVEQAIDEAAGTNDWLLPGR